MSKIKLQIKSIAGSILFEYESEKNTIKETVKEFLKVNQGEIIKGADLSDMDLSDVSFYNSRFDNSRFDNSRFDNSSFYNSSFYNSSFYNSSFYNSSFYNSSFDNSSFYNSSFDNSSFYNSRFDNSSFYNSSFDAATIEHARKNNQLKMFESYKADFWMKILKAKHEIQGLKSALKEGRVDGTTYQGDCGCFITTIAHVRGVRYDSMQELQPDADSPVEKWFYGINKGDTPENSEIAKLTLEWIEEFEMYLNAN